MTATYGPLHVELEVQTLNVHEAPEQVIETEGSESSPAMHLPLLNFSLLSAVPGQFALNHKLAVPAWAELTRAPARMTRETTAARMPTDRTCGQKCSPDVRSVVLRYARDKIQFGRSMVLTPLKLTLEQTAAVAQLRAPKVGEGEAALGQ